MRAFISKFNSRKFCAEFVWYWFVPVAVLSIAGFFSRFHWIADVASDFRVQYTIAFSLAAAVWMFLGWRRSAALALTLAVLNVASIIPLYISDGGNHRGGAASLRLLYMNVCYANAQYGRTMEVVRRLSPDMVAVSEVTPAWENELERRLLPEYPYRISESRPGAFGIALYSRIPWTDATIVHWGGELPSAVATLELGGKSFSILTTHPPPPVNRAFFDYRNNQLLALIKERKTLNNSLIVAADFNATSWSYWFNLLKDRMGLIDTRQGYGPQPSWPTGVEQIAWKLLWIPIDHVLVTPDWVTVKREICEPIGSDHLPVFVELTRNN
jgi:endonuclease/exonuclease/phosphatase (EEP) superfamily protein YafD